VLDMLLRRMVENDRTGDAPGAGAVPAAAGPVDGDPAMTLPTEPLRIEPPLPCDCSRGGGNIPACPCILGLFDPPTEPLICGEPGAAPATKIDRS